MRPGVPVRPRHTCRRDRQRQPSGTVYDSTVLASSALSATGWASCGGSRSYDFFCHCRRVSIGCQGYSAVANPAQWALESLGACECAQVCEAFRDRMDSFPAGVQPLRARPASFRPERRKGLCRLDTGPWLLFGRLACRCRPIRRRTVACGRPGRRFPPATGRGRRCTVRRSRP